MQRFRPFTVESTPHHLHFEAFGVPVMLRASSEELLSRAQAFLPPGWRPAGDQEVKYDVGILQEQEGGFSVYTGTVRASENQGLELSLVVLEGQVRGLVALHAPDFTFVHAGAVAHEGRAIVLPGNSFAGKSTLTAALVAEGALYYSDEFTVLDEHGLVHPYPKAVSLRRPDAMQADHTVESLGGTAGTDPVPIGLAAVTYYEPGSRWSPRELGPGEGVLALLSHTVIARTRPDQALATLRGAMENAVALEGPRGEAEETARLLLSAVGAPA